MKTTLQVKNQRDSSSLSKQLVNVTRITISKQDQFRERTLTLHSPVFTGSMLDHYSITLLPHDEVTITPPSGWNDWTMSLDEDRGRVKFSRLVWKAGTIWLLEAEDGPKWDYIVSPTSELHLRLTATL